MRAVSSGDAGAREQFVARMRCVPRILAVLNQRTGRPLNDEQLADLAQDTVLVVWRKLAEFREGGTLEAWVYGIAYLEFRNACRSKSREQLRRVSFAESSEPSSREVSESERGDADDVWVALEQLDAEDSLVIRLRHEEDRSFDEIGRRLGIPMNTAKTRYHRGLQRLRELLRIRNSQEGHPR